MYASALLLWACEALVQEGWDKRDGPLVEELVPEKIQIRPVVRARWKWHRRDLGGDAQALCDVPIIQGLLGGALEQ